MAALAPLPPSDRAGFLFGVLVAILLEQGFDRTGIEQELENGLDAISAQLEKEKQ